MRRTIRATAFAALGFGALLAAPGSSVGAPVQWTVASGGNGHWYERITDGAVGWTAAKAAAEANGGHLVTITSLGEQTFINTALFGLGGPFDESLRGSWWIGLSDAAVEGSFAWVTGEALSFQNWGGGQPDNNTQPNFGGAGGEDYAQLVWRPDPTSPYPGGWNDAPEAGYTGRTDFPNLNRRGYIVEYTRNPLAVPAPGALGLFDAALAGLAAVRRRPARA